MSNIDLTQMITAEARAAAALDAAREAARGDLLADIDAAVRAMTGTVPEAEKLSWTTKEAAALAHEADSATPEQAAMLAAEAGITGETLADLAGRVLAAAAAYRQAAAVIAGIRRKYEAEIDAAGDVEHLPARASWLADLAALAPQ